MDDLSISRQSALNFLRGPNRHDCSVTNEHPAVRDNRECVHLSTRTRPRRTGQRDQLRGVQNCDGAHGLNGSPRPRRALEQKTREM